MTWLRLAPYAAGAALLALVWAHGLHTGTAREAARQAEAVRVLEDRLSEVSAANRAAAAELLARRAAQEALADVIEDEARRDPAADVRVPGADSLRRLERRWGAR